MALGRVQPITHAVGNTIKRVVIIVASVIAFRSSIQRLKRSVRSVACGLVRPSRLQDTHTPLVCSVQILVSVAW